MKLEITSEVSTGDWTLSNNVMIRLFDEAGKVVSTTYSSLGVNWKETTPSLAPGRYRVLVTSGHTEPFSAEVEIRAGETAEVKAELHRAAELRVRLLNPEISAAQARAATVEVYDAAGDRVTVGDGVTNVLRDEPSEDASLWVSPLLSGAYRVVVKLPGYADFELNVTLGRGQTVEREIRLSR